MHHCSSINDIITEGKGSQTDHSAYRSRREKSVKTHSRGIKGATAVRTEDVQNPKGKNSAVPGKEGEQRDQVGRKAAGSKDDGKI